LESVTSGEGNANVTENVWLPCPVCHHRQTDKQTPCLLLYIIYKTNEATLMHFISLFLKKCLEWFLGGWDGEGEGIAI